MRYLINLSYDGSKFYGYQIQKNKDTVEGEIERVLSKILNTKINTIASSRTDRGVHSKNQYCHFDYDKKLDVNKLCHSINSLINKSIYVKKIVKVNDDFHARYSVYKKEYIYKINIGEYNPIEKDYVFQYNKSIDKKLLQEFCDIMSGKHNFRSFTSDKDRTDYERDVKISYKINNKILYLKFESSGFLRYMIRNIVGLLIEINDGKKSINDIDKIFKSLDRCSLGRGANSEGLYLNKIEFM
ncbi:MAG: tRNA pseudouridine(38-40) synthase TruA [Bacilli bacterium]|nr:tRNA pseudouridine(38-40) synthase TruA [Bacilli bacterium]